MSEEVKEDKTELNLNKAKVVSSGKGNKLTYSMELEFDEVVTKASGEVIITPMTASPPKHPHIDLFNALKRLVPHWAIDAEEKEVTDFNKKYFESDAAISDKNLERFKVTGILIKDRNKQRHVVLLGRKVLKSGRVINHSPMFNIDNLEDGYIHAEHLAKAVDQYLEEVEMYTEGKVAIDPQITAFPETEAERTKVVTTPKKKAVKSA